MKCGPSLRPGCVVPPIATTTTRSDCLSAARHFPGSPVIGAHRFPHPAGHGAEEALPSSQDDHPPVPRPIRRGVPRRPLPDPRRLPWPSPLWNRLGTPSSPRQCAGPVTTLAQASLALRTGRLLGPASHPASRPRTGAPLPRTRASPQAGLTPAGRPELLARYVMTNSFSSQRPSSLGAPHNLGTIGCLW
jgi:hypothetical protein